MYFAALSDTHGYKLHTQRTVEILKSFDPVAVLHCGDIGSLQIPELLGQWPTHYVCGNVDSRLKGLEAAILQAGGIYHHEFGDITIEDLRIALLHSHIPQTLDKAIQGGLYDVVCYGHTHQAEYHMDAKTLVVNPGALYRARRHTIAIFELGKKPPAIWHVEV